MNPSVGTFISMDSYDGSIDDPVSLHKYLYANANPVSNSDPSGYVTVKEEIITVTVVIVSPVLVGTLAEHKYNEQVMRQGISILRALKAMSTLVTASNIFGDQIIALLDNLKNGVRNLFDQSKKLRDEVIEKTLEDTKYDQRNGKNIYYHATTEAVALKFSLGITNKLKGSEMEGGYIFAWRLCPSKEALNMSGAANAEVILMFSTYSAFEDDWGITNPEVKKFYPVRSVLKGPISISVLNVLPVI